MKRLPLLPVLLLAACAQEPSDAALVLEEVLAAHQASLAAIPGAPAAAAAAAPSRPAAAPASLVPGVSAASMTTAPRRMGSGAVAMAGQLVGHTPDELIQLLGEPRLRRSEGPAEVWHYQATQCHLDVILYPEEGARPTLRVGFAAARAVGTTRHGEAACLRDIARGAGPVIAPSGSGFGIGA